MFPTRNEDAHDGAADDLSDEPDAETDGLGDAPPEDGRSRNGGKSATAFRTISEVSTELEVPQHVLRFWETKFTQLRPLKRGGGRRYYRPEDVALLKRIHGLLYSEGYTIKGVQRVLRTPRKTAKAAGQVDGMLPEIDAGFSDEPPVTETIHHDPADALLRELLAELKALRSLLD